MEAIVLAGGLGTRLAGRLDGLPKPMASIAGRPFLELLLDRLQTAGCGRCMLSVGYRREAIQSHFGATFRGMSLDYVVEETPLGTGGAIRKALDYARESSVLVLNGDTFLDVDYAALLNFHRAAQPPLTMAITPQANIARYGGVVVEDARIAGFEEKGRTGPGWVNAGVYAIQRNFAWPASLPEKFSFETDLLMPEAVRIHCTVFPVETFFLDIGVPEDLDRAQTELKHTANGAHPRRGAEPGAQPPRAVFLDRDGVINRKVPEGQYVYKWEDFELLPGVPEAIARLNRAGLRVLVVSNQRGIALGLYSAPDVISIHDTLQKKLDESGAHIDGFYFCPHDSHACDCRKPHAGLFRRACADFPGLNADASVMIGDSLSDIEFGHNLGMRTIYIEDHLDSREQDGKVARSLADICSPSLAEAVDILMKDSSG